MVVEYFDHIVEKFETVSPMLRAMTQRDVGNAAVLYASDISSAITGAVIPVDGGMDLMIASAGPHPRAAKRSGEKS
jgi:enoyl-[acyl-carrier-protein] reductase (NADH)